MDSPTKEWHYWDRIRLRRLLISQYDSFSLNSKKTERRIVFPYLSGTQEVLLHRLILLMWVGELGFAEKLWEEEGRHRFWGIDFADILFRVIICEISLGSGFKHPEFRRLVNYNVLFKDDAFELSTIPLSKLLEMDKPHFSSVDGLIAVDFDRHELDRIATLVQGKYREELRLPIILLKTADRYGEPYKIVGAKLENMLLQRLLKLTRAPFKKYTEVEEIRELESISMLRRRRFQTIYKVLPETSSVWLTTTQDYPFSP